MLVTDKTWLAGANALGIEAIPPAEKVEGGFLQLRKRNQELLDKGAEAFENSDILRKLREQTDANKAKNRKALQDLYCRRQAEMGVGDCAGLRVCPLTNLCYMPHQRSQNTARHCHEPVAYTCSSYLEQRRAASRRRQSGSRVCCRKWAGCHLMRPPQRHLSRAKQQLMMIRLLSLPLLRLVFISCLIIPCIAIHGAILLFSTIILELRNNWWNALVHPGM